MKKQFRFSVWAMLLVLCVGFVSCNKDDDEPGGSSGSSNALVGKWSFPCTDDWTGTHITPHTTGYWTFNNDGTMLTNDPCDVFNGILTTYSYNAQTKQLTFGGGLVVWQLQWISSTQFKLNGDTYTKVQ